MKKLLSLLLIATLLLPSLSPSPPGPIEVTASSPPPPYVTLEEKGVTLPAERTYRTQVSVQGPHDLERLRRLGVTILSAEDDAAVVLASEEQLEKLAQLRCQPRHTNRVDALLRGVRGGLATASLSMADVLALDSVDSDGDGLTDTEEDWWCTDPLVPDTDNDRVKDGVEVEQLLVGNYAAGKPFLGWPMDPLNDACMDADYDSVPDDVETFVLGLNPDRESTDRDKFDDGQELFGITHCTGSGGGCGWGPLPRDQDWGVIFAEMPSWVKAPGNSPFVAAYPIPEVEVVEGSINVERVVVITTEKGEMMQRTNTYETSEMKGTSSSVSDTETWNQWQEVSVATPLDGYQRLDPVFVRARGRTMSDPWGWKLAGGTLGLVGAMGGAFCVATGGVGCLALGLAGVAGAAISLGTDLIEEIDEAQARAKANRCDPDAPYVVPKCLQSVDVGSGEAQIIDNQAGNISSQDLGVAGGGTKYRVDGSGQAIAQPVVQVSYPRPGPTRTEAEGQSWGGARTTTHTEYEEHTITQGEAFTTGEDWRTAVATDTAHTADMWFTYIVRNRGQDFAHEIAGLAFNIYIGDDPNPAITYYPAADIGGDGKLHDFRPGEEHTYASSRVPLSLEQMKAIDLGGPLYVVLESYSYGMDKYFYEDAYSSGVLFAIEDGIADGDELIDTYLIPSWGSLTAQDALKHYFPVEEDTDGNLLAIWTPERVGGTPSWCESPRREWGALWCRHPLSTYDWWNMYMDGLGDGSIDFKDTPLPPLPREETPIVFLRFNRDSDLDGYSDRSEKRYYCSLPEDHPDRQYCETAYLRADVHPHPELLAGYTQVRSGDHVTATMAFLNTGSYDAYGIEAVMYAPDDSVTVTNNTVGGSGRVRAGHQVVVGSRILDPVLDRWRGTSEPFSGGYYLGDRDRVYTFTAQQTGSIGNGTLTMNWTDGKGASGTLNVGDGYHSPMPLAVGNKGLEIGFLTGSVLAGDKFTVEAWTPRDTFQYTINREPHAQPVIVVSYNDPQGNHRFITPVELVHLTDDLVFYSGQMLKDIGVELSTDAPFDPASSNTAYLVVNSPAPSTIEDGHLFLEFVDITGTIAAEIPVTVTLEPGPTVVPVTWDTSVFSPTFEADQDYIVMAFWTDYQGNIIDTAARPLSSFQEDPLPQFAMDDTDMTWDFGTVTQGTVLQHPVTFANTGFMDLLTYMNAPAGVSLSQEGISRVSPADVVTNSVILDTAGLPTGIFTSTLTIRTSDLDHPTETVHLMGAITSTIADIPPGSAQRPVDWDAHIPGDHGAHEWVEFTHTLGPEPQSLHPVKVYSQDYSTLWGVGRYATPFGEGTASYEMFGDGSDGDLIVGPGQVVAVPHWDPFNGSPLSGNAASGQSTIPVVRTSDFAIGQEILIHQTQGTTGAGTYEFGTIADIESGILVLEQNLEHSYIQGGDCTQVGNCYRAQVRTVPHYRNVTIQSGGTVICRGWWYGRAEPAGGVCALRISGDLVIENNGSFDVSGTDVGPRGFAGAPARGYGTSLSGESYDHGIVDLGYGCPGPISGDGGTVREADHGGGGAGHASRGGNGGGGSCGYGGYAYGMDDLSQSIMLGSGGGAGSWAYASCGGGALVIFAQGIDISGQIKADGQEGGRSIDSGYGKGGAGGGSGGSIFIIAANATLGANRVTALGGLGGAAYPGGYNGGTGSVGRIRVEYCDMLSGSTNPPASTEKLECYIVEQIEESPYDRARLNLPEPFTGGRNYKVQYGRRLVFSGAGELTTALRITNTAYLTATLNALVSDVGSGSLTFRLDVGDDGAWDWEMTQSVDNSATFTSTNLAHALNGYWTAQGAPLTGTADVPVRVYLSKAGRVLLTNLVMTPTGSKVRYIRLSAQDYYTVTLSLAVGDSGSGSLTVAADVGDDGTVDWAWTGFTPFPAHLTTANIASAVNAYLSGYSGEVEMPIRFFLARFAPLALEGFSATPSSQADLTLSEADIAFGASSPTEGDTVPVTATIHNDGGQNGGPATVAFYAEAPDWGEWYIGSAYMWRVPGGGTAQATIEWDTSGFTGTVPVHVMADPYNRVDETDEENNEASTELYIRTRPDLTIGDIRFYPTEPVSSNQVTIRATISNTGETDADDIGVHFYDSTVVTGTLVATRTASVPAQDAVPITTSWTAGPPGEHIITVQADAEDIVAESDEDNNAVTATLTVASAARQEIALGGWDWFSINITPTLPPGGECTGVAESPRFSHYKGSVTKDGRPAPVGALIEAFSPRGEKVGCSKIIDEGIYRYIRVYGVYTTPTSIIPGMRDGEPVSFKVNDFAAASTPSPVIWHDDWLTHTVDLSVSSFMKPGILLASAEGQYDLLLGEEGTYKPPADSPFNTLTQTLPGLGYMIHMTQAATLLITGTRVSEDKPLGLHKGWNWGGYLPDCILPVTVALTSIEGQYDLLLGEEGVYAPPPADPRFNTLNALDPGEGYLMRMTEAHTLVYPAEACGVFIATLSSASPQQCHVPQTPHFSHYYGHATLDGRPVPAGTLVRAFNPRGDEVGCFEVTSRGFYGYMRVYGESRGVTPPIPGLRPGEQVTFKIGDLSAAPLSAPLGWQDDKGAHRLDLATSVWQTYLPMILKS